MPTKPRFLGGFPLKTRSVLRNRQGIPRLSGVSSRAHEGGTRETLADIARRFIVGLCHTAPAADLIGQQRGGPPLAGRPGRCASVLWPSFGGHQRKPALR